MGTYRYEGRVRYYLKSSPEEILDVIRAFAKEKKLGEIVAAPGPLGAQHVRAGYGTWLRNRCLWTCAADALGLYVEFKVLPSLLRQTIRYLSLCLVAVGAVIVSAVFILYGKKVHEHAAVEYGCTVALLGFIIIAVLRDQRADRSRLHIENEFARGLTICHPRVVCLPQHKYGESAIQGGLAMISLVLLTVGLMRAQPVFGVLFTPLAAVLVLRAIAEHLAMASPRFNWRATLSTWIMARTLTCGIAFVGLWFFFVPGTAIIVFAQEQKETQRVYIEALGWPTTYYTSLPMDPSILATNVEFLQGMLRHRATQPDLVVSVLQAGWVVLPWSAIALMILATKFYIDWFKNWTLNRQKPAATPDLPGVSLDVSRATRAGLGGFIAVAAIANVLHLVFTVDILSAMFADQYAISRIIGLSAGWALLDLEAAADGIAKRSPLGIAVLLVLAQPTLLVLLGWTLTALARVLRCCRRVHRVPVEPGQQELVGRLASQMAVHTPVVRVMDRGEPYIETVFSWLPVRATLLISRGTLEVLDERELEAAVAHELAHVKYDARAIVATRWLSALSLFPCNVFALVLDTEQRELRADRTAASVLANTDAVQAAIAKTSVGSVFITTRSGGRQTHGTPTKNQRGRETFGQRLSRYAQLISAVTQPGFLLGYAHPTPAERRTALHIDYSSKRNN